MKLIEVIELKFLFYKGNTALLSNKGIVFVNISVYYAEHFLKIYFFSFITFTSFFIGRTNSIIITGGDIGV